MPLIFHRFFLLNSLILLRAINSPQYNYYFKRLKKFLIRYFYFMIYLNFVPMYSIN